MILRSVRWYTLYVCTSWLLRTIERPEVRGVLEAKWLQHQHDPITKSHTESARYSTYLPYLPHSRPVIRHRLTMSLVVVYCEFLHQ